MSMLSSTLVRFSRSLGGARVHVEDDVADGAMTVSKFKSIGPSRGGRRDLPCHTTVIA